MTEGPASAADEFLAELAKLRQATLVVSYAMLARQAKAQQPPLELTSQRLSDWFNGRAVPTDPAVVRFLVTYLQTKIPRDSDYQRRPLPWWLNLHQTASLQRQTGRAGGSPAVPARSSHRLGLPVDDCDPLTLEVHRAIQIPDTGNGTPAGLLPGYVPRAHDTVLREVADQVLGGGSSQLVTLVGGSSTGKTRACWELVRYLDQRQPGRWRVWHPYDPTRPQAAVADLQRVGPHTVVWLNEAQHYLMLTDPGLGERLAARLRTLLQDPRRAPVLVLATLWPQYWDTLTVRPTVGGPDPYAQARELLDDTLVPVADTFTPEQIAELAATGIDARLQYAAEHAEDGRITQYLAGAPELQTRYRTVGPAARALIQVAMDARRLGHPLAITHTLLERAAPGYLDDHDWDSLGDDWLEQALADTARPCRGARGPLTRIRSRPHRPHPDGGPHYRLADYLEQTGRTERAGVYPPDSLWTAFATTITDPDLLNTLASQAQRRGRYQHAIWLYRQAADSGDTGALRELALLREQAGDAAGAEALAVQAADSGDIDLLRELAERRERVGDADRAEALYRQAADRGDAFAARMLAKPRSQDGDTAGAETLAAQAAGRGNTFVVRMLTELREQGGDTLAAEALYREAADRGDSGALRMLAELRRQDADAGGAEALYRQAADLGDTLALRMLIELREQIGDTATAETLAAQAGDRGDTLALRMLAELRRQDGDTGGAEALYRQAADRGDTLALRMLAELREQIGDTATAETLAAQATDRGDAGALRDLARRREQDGDTTGAEALYRQAADRGDTLALRMLAELRERIGDAATAETLTLQAADRGDAGALRDLARRRERNGDTASVDRLRRFGLTGSGEIVTGLDFDSPIPGLSD